MTDDFYYFEPDRLTVRAETRAFAAMVNDAYDRITEGEWSFIPEEAARHFRHWTARTLLDHPDRDRAFVEQEVLKETVRTFCHWYAVTEEPEKDRDKAIATAVLGRLLKNYPGMIDDLFDQGELSLIFETARNGVQVWNDHIEYHFSEQELEDAVQAAARDIGLTRARGGTTRSISPYIVGQLEPGVRVI